jgi:UDP-N-acetylmuramate dehydrogenase
VRYQGIEIPAIKGKTLFDEPLASYTSFRVGGPADVLAIPDHEDDLCALLAWAHQHEIPVLILGGGYNLLVSDKGVRGLVLKLGSGFDRIMIEGTTITVGASTKLPVLVDRATEAGLAGLEGLTGVPGTVGGAVCMNAGTRYGYVSDTLQCVRAVDLTGTRHCIEVKDLGLQYRESRIAEKGLIIVEALFQLREGCRADIGATCTELLDRRRLQPCTVGTAGSTFKNPSCGYAGELIEEAGGKGMRIGGAEVSTTHANFFFNVDNATAADIRALITEVQEMVRKRFGVELQPEVQIVGEW